MTVPEYVFSVERSLTGGSFAGLAAISNVKENWEVNPSFGGPIKKDTLWYYYSLRYQRAQNYAAGMFQNANAFNLSKFTYVPTTTQALVTNGYWDDSQLRLTWQANPKNKFSGFYDDQPHCTCNYQSAGLLIAIPSRRRPISSPSSP